MLLGFSFTGFGQYQLEKDQMQINIGTGLSTRGLPFYAGLDYGLFKDISVGGEISVRVYNESVAAVKYKHNIFGITANGNYHFSSLWKLPKEWDLYAGVNIGVYLRRSPASYPGAFNSPANAGAQIGGRYYMSDKFAFNAEIGTGNAFSAGKIGITLKL